MRRKAIISIANYVDLKCFSNRSMEPASTSQQSYMKLYIQSLSRCSMFRHVAQEAGLDPQENKQLPFSEIRNMYIIILLGAHDTSNAIVLTIAKVITDCINFIFPNLYHIC